MADKPKATSSSMNAELEKVAEHFDQFESQVKSLTQDEMNKAPLYEAEPQTRLSNREAQKADAPYLKPERSIPSREPFNERFRDEYNRRKRYVKVIAENNEIIGESIEKWSKPYPGLPAEFWRIPVNKPIYIPEYVAEEVAKCQYHRLVTEDEKITGTDGYATYHGGIVVKETRRRLDCRPVGFGHVFMGS